MKATRTLGCLVCALALALVASADPNIVSTSAGFVEGTVEAGARVFRGIPYAAPPLGSLRFRPPQPVAPWTDVLKCTSEPSMCPQLDSVGPFVLGSEDCLYLNVYAPENATSTSNLPVMIWIFGGGWVVGDGWEFSLYDGMALASKHNVVIVTMNYRLSVLGFAALDALLAEDGTTGNTALLDQRAAFVWVQTNIAQFGGNAGNVTIFGESAGAFSTCWHLASAADTGLFHAALLESGTCDSPVFFVPLADAVSWSEAYAASVGCKGDSSADILACLRQLDTAKLLSGHPKSGAPGYTPWLLPVMPWGAAIDGAADGLMGVPLALIASGQGVKGVHTVVMGTNNNEGTIFVPMLADIVNVRIPLTEATTIAVLGHFFNETTVAAILTQYPVDPTNYDYDAVAANCLRDYFFVCATRRALGTWAANGVATYQYRFTYEDGDPLFKWFGDSHASELRFVWSWSPPVMPWTGNDSTMADTFGTYWTNTAKYGAPSGGPGSAPYVDWPQWVPGENELNVVLDVPTSVQDDMAADACAFWADIGLKAQ